MQKPWDDLDRRAINMAKVLTADAVERAGNGHPGSAISLAPIVYALYQRYLTHDPTDPHWPGRDRFILSGGHASLAQYTQLFLAGYGLTLDDLRNYRSGAHTRTPGHPELGVTPGLEMTTGPLGQGLASAVGFAYGQRYQRGLLDPDAPRGSSPFDHRIWAICGEGDLEEGVSAEACSLAGDQSLDNLTVIYDANHIQIEGDTSMVLGEDVCARMRAYGWYTDSIDFVQPDGSYKEDLSALSRALDQAGEITDRPKFIKVNTLIAWPTPGLTNDASTHGSPLGAKALADLKSLLGFDPNEDFPIDEEALAHARQAAQRGVRAHADWDRRYRQWRKDNPKRAALYDRIRRHEPPKELDSAIDELENELHVGDSVPARQASGRVLNAIAPIMPELWGGSADLGSACMTDLEGADSFAPAGRATRQFPKANPYGRQIHFGVREFAMGAITNGILLDSDTRPFGSTFFQFADYERPAVRLAALMDIPNIYIWTHDSIALGQDGPTHQPVEHLAAMRAIPRLAVVRPADEFETAEAYRHIFEKSDTHPTAIVLSRQPLPNLAATAARARQGVSRGAYILQEPENRLDMLIMASGSEVQLALEAANRLAIEGIGARVVSVPCMEWFEQQDQDYRSWVMPEEIRARVSVEAGLALSWHQYLGDAGKTVSVEDFGLQGDGESNLIDYGITADHVVDAAHASLLKVGRCGRRCYQRK